MDQATLLALIGVCGTGLTFLLGWVAKWVVRYLRESLNIKVTDSQAAMFEWAASQAARSTEQYFRSLVLPPEQKSQRKLEHAIATTRSLAPAATKNVTDERIAALVEAQVATMRASQPAPSAVLESSSNAISAEAAPEFLSLTANDGTVLYTRSIQPPAFPPPPALARESVTKSDRAD